MISGSLAFFVPLDGFEVDVFHGGDLLGGFEVLADGGGGLAGEGGELVGIFQQAEDGLG